MIVGQATNSFRRSLALFGLLAPVIRYHLSLSLSRIFLFFLWRNGRIWNAALFPSFLPEKLSGISFSRTSYETRILFSNWCNCFLEDAGLSSGSCFLFYHSGNVKGATLVTSSFSPHSDLCDLKLNIRSWSWWVLDFEDKRWSILFSNLSYLQGYLRSFFLFFRFSKDEIIDLNI